jgi:hypothetical protein
VTTAQYAVVRYIGDPARNEALNVGIILWNERGFVLDVDEAAAARVVRENPHLARDSLLYLKEYLRQRLSRTVPPFTDEGFLRVIAEQTGFPVLLTQPRTTTLTTGDEGGMRDAMERLINRVVRPARRSGGQPGLKTTAHLQRELKPFIQQQRIQRNVTFEAPRTHAPRSVDFYANTGANVALDVVNLTLSKADAIRDRADQEAFKIWELLQSPHVERYYVLGVFAGLDSLREINDIAANILSSTGGKLISDVDEARHILETAATRSVMRR